MAHELNTWYDSTTYSQGDNERKPSCWTFDTGKIKISLLNKHRDHAGKWVMHCFNLGMNTVVFKASIETPVEEMQKAAIRVVQKKLTEMLNSLNLTKSPV